MSLSDFEEDIDHSVRDDTDDNQKTSRPITEDIAKEGSADHLPVDEEPARENAPAEEEVEEPSPENAPADEEIEEPVEETAPVDEEVEEPVQETAPVDEEVEEPVQETAPVDEEVEEPSPENAPADEEIEEPVQETAPVDEEVEEPVQETAPVDEEVEEPSPENAPADEEIEEPVQEATPRNDLSKSPSVASSSPINDEDGHNNDAAPIDRDESKNEDMYAEDFNASSRAATPPTHTKENERQSATPPPQAPPLSSASPSNPRHKKFAVDDAGDEAKRSSTFADDDESDDSSSISSLDSEKNAERKQQKQEEKKKKEKRKSVAKERAIRASRTVRVRGGIGTNGNTKDHRPGHIRVVSYLRDLSDFEKAHYKEECGLESGVGAVPIRMRRGVGVQDLGVGAATTATDGNQTGITRVALVEQGEFAHYRFDDCLWGCSSLIEETAQPSVPDATSLFDNVAAPLVTKLLQTGTPEDDPQSVVNASILCVGAESSGKGTVLFGGINPQPLNADFEAMRQHQQRLGIIGGKVKITNPNEVGAPQGISYVEKNRRIRAAKEAAAGGDATKKAPPKKAAAQKGPKDPRPSTFEDIPASGGGVAADDGLVVRTLDALLKGCAGTERDVFVSFLRLDGTRDRLYNLIAPASDSQEASTEASSLGKSNEEYSDDDAHVATPTSSGPAAQAKDSRKKSDMNALQTLALTLQSQVQCRPITVPVHKSDPTLGTITTYSLRGIKPIKLSSVTQAKRLLFAARQRCQINIPQSADHKVVNEFQELGGLSDPSTTSIVSVIYLIPRTNDVGAPPLQKLIIAGLSTSNSSHISSSMGQTQLAVGNSLADAVRFGRRGFPEAGYKDITHFRDSTLSRALKECIFGPQAAVTVLGCLAPTTRYALPTHNTIRFLDRIKAIDIPEEALDGAVLEADTRIAEEAGSKPPVQPSPPLTHYRILGTIGNGQGAAGASAEFDAVVNTRADEKRNNRGMGGYGLNGEGGTAAAGGEANNQENDEDGKKRSGFRLPGEKRDGPLWKDKYKGPLQLDHKAPTEAVGFVFNNHGQYNNNGGGSQQQVQPQAARKFLYDARKAQKDENDMRHELMQNEREAFVSLARKDMKGRLTYFRANPKVSRANPTTFAEYEKLEARRKAQKQAQIALYEERKRGGGKGGRDVSPSSFHNDPKGYADDFEGQAKEKDDNDSEGGRGDSDDENDFETSVKPHPVAKSKARVAVEAAAGGPHPHAKYGFFKGDNRNAPVPSNATYALEQGEKDRNKIKKPRPFALPAGMKRKQPPKPVVEEEPPAPPAKKVITPRQPVKRPAPPAGSKSNPTGASPRPTAKSKQPMPPAPSKGPANPRDTTPPATETSRASSSSSSVSKASSSRRSASSSSLPSKSIDSRRASKPAPRKESVAASSVKDMDDAEDLDEDDEPDQSDDEDHRVANEVVAEEQPVEEEEAPLPEYIIPLSDLHFPNSTEGKRVVDFFGHRAHLSNFRLEGDVLPDGRRASYIEDKGARQELEAASIRLYNPELFDDREEARNNRAVIYRDMIRANGKDVPPSSDSPSKAPVVMFAGVMRGIHLEAYRIYKELEDAEQGRKKPLFTKRIRPSETSLEVPLLVSCLSGGDEQAAFAPELLQPNCSHPKLVAFVSGVFGESCSLLSTARKAYQYVLRGDDPPNPASPGDKELKWSQFRRFCSFIGAYYEILTEVCGYMRNVATALNGGTPLRPLTEADIDVCLDQLTSSSKTIPVGTALSFLNEAVSDEVTARLIAYSYQYLQVSECAFKYYYDGDDASTTGIYNKHHARNIAVIKPGLDVFEKWCEDHWALDHSQIKTRLTAQGKTVPEETVEDGNGNTVTRLIVHNGVISNPFYLTEWLVRKVINRLEFQEEDQVTDEVEAAWISRANDVTNVTDDDDVEQEVEEFEEYEEEEEEEEEEN